MTMTKVEEAFGKFAREIAEQVCTMNRALREAAVKLKARDVIDGTTPGDYVQLVADAREAFRLWLENPDPAGTPDQDKRRKLKKLPGSNGLILDHWVYELDTSDPADGRFDTLDLDVELVHSEDPAIPENQWVPIPAPLNHFIIAVKLRGFVRAQPGQPNDYSSMSSSSSVPPPP